MSIVKLNPGKIEDLDNGKKIKLMHYTEEHVEKLAYEKVKEMPDDWEWKGKNKEYWLKYFEANIPVKKTWKDYALHLVNSHPTKWVKEGWSRKLRTSEKHWSHHGSAVFESIRDALWVLHYAKNPKYIEYPEESNEYKIFWDQIGFTEISRMPIVKLFRIPQDSPENSARYYIKEIIKGLQDDREEKCNEAMEELKGNKYLMTMLFGEGGSMEEIKELPKSMRYLQHPWASQENTKMIPSSGDARMFVLEGDYREAKRVRDQCDMETLIQVLTSGAERYFSDQLKASASYKRIVVAAIRNDVNLTYMGFGPTTEQLLIQSQAMAAFETKKEEKEKAMKQFEELKVKLQKEKQKESAM